MSDQSARWWSRKDNPQNICAIKRLADGAWFQRNTEHGCGWTDRIRQSWTYREAVLEVQKMYEAGLIYLHDMQIVELAEATPVSA